MYSEALNQPQIPSLGKLQDSLLQRGYRGLSDLSTIAGRLAPHLANFLQLPFLPDSWTGCVARTELANARRDEAHFAVRRMCAGSSC